MLLKIKTTIPPAQVDTLVRFDFCEASEADQLEASFAARISQNELSVEALAETLEEAARPHDDALINNIRAAIEKAGSLEGAQIALLVLQAEHDAYALQPLFRQAFEAAALAGHDSVQREVAEDSSFAEVEGIRLPFKEQIDFFRQKQTRPTKAWDDILHGDHDRAFMVAGAKDRDMLADFHNAILKAMEDGTGYNGFLKDFDTIVAKYGWSYKGERGWRSRTIYHTNMRTSYAAGRLKQMRDPDVVKLRPFWMYKHGVTRKPKVPRARHEGWDGLVLRHDDHWWETHYPPNGWLCSCGVVTLSRRDLKKLGREGPSSAPEDLMVPVVDKKTGQLIQLPQGIEPGWQYQPGDKWERGLVPSAFDGPSPKPLVVADTARDIEEVKRKAKPVRAKPLPEGKRPEFYAKAFMRAFGLKPGESKLHTDAMGEKILISDQMLRTATGAWKVLKRGRGPQMKLLAEAIRNPDEIWLGVTERKIPDEQGGGLERVLERKYVRVDPDTGLLAIFELFGDYWDGKTAFPALNKRAVRTDFNQVNRRRQGKLVWSRQK